jgi:predicted alpha/beta hydrolase family esterase
MTRYFIVPGLGNSGPAHWQTYFEETVPNCVRIQQQEWDAPAAADWIGNINNALKDTDLSSVVLIGHSLGCATIAHWYQHYKKPIKGALLVAPSDLEATAYTFPATGFSPIPLTPFPFKTIVAASTTDEWVSFERAAYFASCWGSELVNVGDAGHINAAAGYGPWSQGTGLLKRF